MTTPHKHEITIRVKEGSFEHMLQWLRDGQVVSRGEGHTVYWLWYAEKGHPSLHVQTIGMPDKTLRNMIFGIEDVLAMGWYITVKLYEGV